MKTPTLRPLQKVDVPLWVACLLKDKARCNIVPPAWLQEDSLRAIYEQELKDQYQFSSQLPWEWLEIAQCLLDVAPDDMGAPVPVIRTLLRDVREVRQAKARTGMKELNESHMRMDNLGNMEVNEMRPFVGRVMDQLRTMAATRQAGDGELGAGGTGAEEIGSDDEIGDDGAF